jgi:hypothetical protein
LVHEIADKLSEIRACLSNRAMARQGFTPALAGYAFGFVQALSQAASAAPAPEIETSIK